MINKKGKAILVTGATGHQGGAVVSSLIKSGWEVYALSRGHLEAPMRSLRERGARIVIGDMEDKAVLENAMKEMYGVFAVTSFMEKGIETEKIQGKNLAGAAKKSGVKHFIFSSVGSADRNTGIPYFESKREIELYIKALGLPATIFRPVTFMINYERPEMRDSILNGVFRTPNPPDKKIQLIALEDLGDFVSLAFENPGEYIGMEIDLAGDELTMTEITGAFSKVLGQNIRYEQIPLEEIRKQNEMMYLSARWGIESGHKADIGALRKLYPKLTKFEDWLHRHNWSKMRIIKAA